MALSLDEHGNCEIGDSEQIAGHETGNIQEAYSIVMGECFETRISWATDVHFSIISRQGSFNKENKVWRPYCFGSVAS